jgi:tetratricopeptide (TPR) repeat protein
MVRTVFAWGLCSWLLLRSAVACADPAAAEALFREGRALLARGDVDSACQKLEASNSLEPSSGTLLNLAACRLKQGRTATAWAHFVAAEGLAQQQDRPEQAEEAKERALELEAKLSTLTLIVPTPPPGFEVRRGSDPIPAGNFGVRVPVDPGKIVIEAAAPGYEPLRLEVTIGEPADHRVLTVPRLKKLEVATHAAPAPKRSNERSNMAPWVIGGIGGAALVTGGVFGVLALASNSKAKEQCQNRTSDCADEALQTAARRDREALASTIGVGVGLLGVGVAALWLLSSDHSNDGDQVSPWTWDSELTRESALLRVRAEF